MRVGRDVFFGLWAERNLSPRGGAGNGRVPFDLCKIGGLLKSAREKKGLTHEEISGVLLIRKKIVNAIEAGDWMGLPPVVYVRGYVMQYASFLDILDLVRQELSFGEEALSTA